MVLKMSCVSLLICWTDLRKMSLITFDYESMIMVSMDYEFMNMVYLAMGCSHGE